MIPKEDPAKSVFFSVPKQEAYKAAIEEILDVPGLSKLRNIMEMFDISYVVFDFNLQISCKRVPNYRPLKHSKKIKKN